MFGYLIITQHITNNYEFQGIETCLTRGDYFAPILKY